MNKYRFTPQANTGTLSEDDSKKYFSTVGFAIFAFMLISYTTSFFASLFMAKFVPSWLENTAIVNGLSLIAQYGIALPAALTILKRLPKDTNPSENLGVGGFFASLCAAFTFITVGSSIASLLTGGIELLTGNSLTNPVENAAYGESFIINLIYIGILAPVIEELVFRKILCDRLLPLGEGYAIFLSAAIFGLVHGNLFQYFYAFLVGMLFSYIYIRTGRVRYTMVIHMIANCFGGVILPWIIEKLAPIFTEEMYVRLTEAMYSSDTAAMEALAEELSPYMLPVLVYSGYELIFTILSMVGVFVIFNHIKKIKLREGLLPPDRGHRISNIFCNGGVALAITAFAVIFIVSLI